MAGYGSDNGFTAWLASNGYTAPANSPAVAQLRQRASDYIDGLYEGRFLGVRSDPVNQERAWPRTGVVVGGHALPSGAVPTAVERAAYAAAYHEGANPGSLSVSASQSGAIKREKIGPIETEYAANSDDVLGDAVVRLSAVESALAFLLRPLDAPAGLGLWAVG